MELIDTCCFLSTASPYVLAIHLQILKMDEFVTKEIGCHRIDDRYGQCYDCVQSYSEQENIDHLFLFAFFFLVSIQAGA